VPFPTPACYAFRVIAQEDFAGEPSHLAELARRLEGWRPDRTGTLMFLHHAGRVLLIRKRRGHGAGKINGPGGKPEPGETPLQCVIRETEEETGLHVHAPRLAAVFRFIDIHQPDWLGFIYRAGRWSGEPRVTAEAFPDWYPITALPFDEMWEDDRLWLPRVLSGDLLEGDFLFADGALLAHRLRAVAHPDAFTVPSGCASTS
jgi:8-oxo-dGTP diphosphatase